MKLRLIGVFFVFVYILACHSALAQTQWVDCAELVANGSVVLEGKGWSDTESFYDRLPRKAKGVVPGVVWGLGHDSAGCSLRFETDTDTLQVRWTLTKSRLAMPHMPAIGVSGMDLYIKADDGNWRFHPRKFSEGNRTSSSVFSLGAGRTVCLLYLPLYNGVKLLEIGIPKGKIIAPIQESRGKPIVVYGTSITQGACASRPGMAWTAITGRALDVPIINLGFSGSGKMEIEMAGLLAELDASIYVLDCLWNMPPALVAERVEPFVRKLRFLRPNTPILLVEDGSYQNRNPTVKRNVLRTVYEKLKIAGIENLYFQSSEGMLGVDGEGTVDGIHPNDLGMMRRSRIMENSLQNILTEKLSAE